MSPEEIKQLEEIECWSWDKYYSQWMDIYDKFVRYVDEFGDASPPARRRDDQGILKTYEIGTWVSVQRREYKQIDLNGNKKIPQWKIDLLEKIDGWVWDIRIQSTSLLWLEKYSYLKEYVSLNNKLTFTRGKICKCCKTQ